ncbi:MAG: DNA primase [Ruminococcaceae bacterium]|nr:DNA primase [Oscillospiraceae bacterium]
MIPKEIIEEIRYRSDIEDVIGTYVTLKRAGSNRNGLCPFHSEKTPSFTVFPTTKSFYCFGCGAGGDVITFIQKIENLDYVAAVELLATRAGITIPNDVTPDTAKNVSRRRVYEMNLEAAKFFRSALFDPTVGAEAMQYLTEHRRMGSAVIKRFGLGYAPNDFGLLTRHMRQKGFGEDELVEAFLSGRSRKSGKLYDLFRNRIMFPVIDTAGNIVAFGGRVMDDSKPKYLNSADTPGFKKSRILFGLNYAKDHCAQELILCEGYMDTIAMHAAGFENAVATLGTAITSEHARLLSRYTKRVVINYDSDEAGQKAAEKAMQLLSEVGLTVRVLKLSGAKDADEFIRRYGADRFRSVMEASRTAFDFRLENILSRYDIMTAEGKIRAAREITSLIAGTGSGVERELYLRAASERLGISGESLGNDVARVRTRMRREARQKESREVRMSARSFGDRVNPDAAKSPAAAAAEEVILGLLLLYPEHRRACVDGRVELGEADFFTDFGKRSFHAVMEMERSADGFSFSALGEHFTPDEMGRLVRLQQDRGSLQNNDLSVLTAAAASLIAEREKREAKEAGDWQSEIARRRTELQKKKEQTKI